MKEKADYSHVCNHRWPGRTRAARRTFPLLRLPVAYRCAGVRGLGADPDRSVDPLPRVDQFLAVPDPSYLSAREHLLYQTFVAPASCRCIFTGGTPVPHQAAT